MPADDVSDGSAPLFELTVLGARSATPEAMRAAAVLLPDLDVPEPTVLPLDRFDVGLDLFLRRAAL